MTASPQAAPAGRATAPAGRCAWPQSPSSSITTSERFGDAERDAARDAVREPEREPAADRLACGLPGGSCTP